MYVVFLGNMVFNIVERRSLETEARNLSNEVSDLEVAYLSLSKDVDINLSREFGFHEIKPNFATREALGFGSKNSSNNEI